MIAVNPFVSVIVFCSFDPCCKQKESCLKLCIFAKYKGFTAFGLLEIWLEMSIVRLF